MDIQSRIKDVLNTSMQNDAGGQLAHLREEDLLEALRKKGVIDDVMQQLQFETTHNMSNSENVAPMTNAEEMKPATHYIDKDSRLSAKQTYRGQYVIYPVTVMSCAIATEYWCLKSGQFVMPEICKNWLGLVRKPLCMWACQTWKFNKPWSSPRQWYGLELGIYPVEGLKSLNP